MPNRLTTREVADLLAVGRIDDAVHWYGMSAAQGDDGALSYAFRALERAGRFGDATRLRTYGWEPDGSIASPWPSDPCSAS